MRDSHELCEMAGDLGSGEFLGFHQTLGPTWESTCYCYVRTYDVYLLSC